LGDESLESVQTSARKWIDIRTETSRLRSDWAWQRDLLESTREALAFKVEQLEAQVALLEATTASAREKLEANNEELASLSAQLGVHEQHNQNVIQTLESLRPFMPPRLSESLDLAFNSLADPDLPPAERMQLVGTVLNRSFQFNNTITYSEEIVRTSDTDAAKVMSVLYWGLGQAYALDRNSGKAYVGRPGESDWIWSSIDGFENEINTLINVFNEQTDPVLVRIPVHIQTGDGE
jgi:hypothetical protein